LCKCAAPATRFFENQVTHRSLFPMRGTPPHNAVPP
jgi:hypothetical protein